MKYRGLRNKTLTSLKNDEAVYQKNKLKGKNQWNEAKKLLNIKIPQLPTRLISNDKIITKPQEICET